jgi:predicted metal-dependent peptidase
MSQIKQGQTGLKFDKKRDEKALEKLTQARIALLLKQPFFGNLALRLELVNADEQLTTLATDGYKFYYNSEFVMSLPDRELVFGVAHEVLHCAYAHVGSLGAARLGNRDKGLWNMALDYCINADLVENKVGDLIKTIEICYDPKYANMTAEQVYDQLIQDGVPPPKAKGGGENGEGDAGGSFDYHFDEVDDPEKLADDMLNAVIQAAAAAGAGKTPLGVQRYIDKILKPVIDWREMIDQNIQSMVKSDFTFMRPSRRSFSCDAILPGSNVDSMIDVWVVLDMSGSTGPFVKEMVSEVFNIVDSYQDYKVNIIQFDTEVYNHAVFTPENRSDLDTYEFKGGGGTMFECVYDFWKENDITPKKAIWFSDLCPCGTWGDDNYADTLWIGHGTTSIVPPYGQTAYFDSEAKKQS